jgi:hypothetical protein
MRERGFACDVNECKRGVAGRGAGLASEARSTAGALC